MTRRTVLLAVAALTIGVGAVHAHDGHAHIVMGSVTAVDTKHLELKTPRVGVAAAVPGPSAPVH